MKKWFSLLFLFIIQAPVFSQGLTGHFSYCGFDVPGKSPYLETYFSINGHTINYVNINDSTRQGQLEVVLIVRSGEKIIHFDKYNLNSPPVPVKDAPPDMIDLQRINLDSGKYELELAVKDKNKSEKETQLKQEITIGYRTDTVSISDIELIQSYQRSYTESKFTKSGYEIIPFINTNGFYPKEITRLRFYAEVYRSDKLTPADDYLVRYFISENENKKVLEDYMVSVKQKPQPVNVILGDLPMENLPSGNYLLNIEIRSKQNKLLAYRQIFFQRSNIIRKPLVTDDIFAIDITNTFVSNLNNPDTLKEYIDCLYPVSSSVETEAGENILKSGNVKNMQQYIYYFWQKRNPYDPWVAFSNYMAEVKKANEAFGTQIRKGYETDRGRVFLKYGSPNIISDNKNEPSTTPYQIWQYYKLDGQSNKKFVFRARESSSNDYKLLHSDAIGEINDPDWQRKLYGLQNFGNTLDPVKPDKSYGNHSEEFFTNPH